MVGFTDFPSDEELEQFRLETQRLADSSFSDFSDFSEYATLELRYHVLEPQPNTNRNRDPYPAWRVDWASRDVVNGGYSVPIRTARRRIKRRKVYKYLLEFNIYGAGPCPPI